MCKISPELFDGQEVTLFPGKQQHWILAFPASGISDRMRLMFFRNRYLADLGIALKDITITGRREGRASAVKQLNKGRDATYVAQYVDINPDKWIPHDTVFLSIAFDLESGPDSIEWPWDYTDCQGDLTDAGGVFAVFPPSQIVRIPEPDVIGDTIDDIGQDAGEVGDKASDVASKLVSFQSGIAIGAVALGAFLLWKRN